MSARYFSFLCWLICLPAFNFAQTFAEEKFYYCESCQVDPSLYWIRTDLLLWNIKDSPVSIPLVTTASLDNLLPGALGQSGTRVKLGDSKAATKWQKGFQITAGAWTNETQSAAVEGSYFIVPKHTHRDSIATSGEPGSPNYAVPIYDVTGLWGLNGVPGETIFVLPGPLFDLPGFRGRFSLKVGQRFQGTEANALFRLYSTCAFNLEAIGGLRWVQLNESLIFKVNTHSVPDFAFATAFYNTIDEFRTTNDFLGGQIGIRLKYFWQGLRLNGTAKLGLGVMNEHVDISGTTQTSSGNLFYETKGTAQTPLAGGIFAQPTNIGSHNKQVFATLLDLSLNGTYPITKSILFSVGYHFLWMNHIVRPGDQLNRKINPTRTGLANASKSTIGTQAGPVAFSNPSPASPGLGSKKPDFSFKSQDLWAHGLTIGLQIEF